MKKRLCALLQTVVVLTLATGAATAGQADATAVSFFDFETRAPASWTSVQPSSSMRLLQMSVPGPDDADADAEVVVFFFGSGQGGDVTANVARWRSQFAGEDGGEVEPLMQTFEVAGMPVTVAELSGTYRRAVGGAPAQPLAGQTLVAAVVETDRGSLFIQLHGPSGTVASHRDGFDAFVRGLHPAGY